MSAENTLAVVFDGHVVSAVVWEGRPAWVAAQVGVALGYPDGRVLAQKVTGAWSEEFIPGHDFDVLKNGRLAAFKEQLSTLGVESSVDPRTPSLLILFQPGLDLALLKTRKPAGRRLRRVLADTVLPQLRATGTATLPGAPAPALPPPTLAPKQLPVPRTPPAPAAPKRINEHPYWPELRRGAESTTHYPVVGAMYFELAGEFVPPASLRVSSAMVDELAYLAFRHYHHTGKR